MEQELIELLLVAKKALSTGQAICAQANERTQETEQYTEAIVKAWPKILFLHNHILIQLSTLERIREFLTVKTEEVHNCITVIREKKRTGNEIERNKRISFLSKGPRRVFSQDVHRTSDYF